ncbi:hypothetical protein ACLIA0_05740 [Bacillaceae bacterium W0354]
MRVGYAVVGGWWFCRATGAVGGGDCAAVWSDVVIKAVTTYLIGGTIAVATITPTMAGAGSCATDW